MRKFTSAFAALAMMSSAFVGSTTASAAHSYTYSGLVDVFKGIPLLCTVTVVKTPDHDPVTGDDLNTGTVVITVGPPVDPLCGILNITSNPMIYTQGPADPVTGWKEMVVEDFRAETVTAGNCADDEVIIKKRKNPVTGQWEMDVTTVISEETGGGDCVIEGVIPKI